MADGTLHAQTQIIGSTVPIVLHNIFAKERCRNFTLAGPRLHPVIGLKRYYPTAGATFGCEKSEWKSPKPTK